MKSKKYFAKYVENKRLLHLYLRIWICQFSNSLPKIIFFFFFFFLCFVHFLQVLRHILKLMILKEINISRKRVDNLIICEIICKNMFLRYMYFKWRVSTVYYI